MARLTKSELLARISKLQAENARLREWADEAEAFFKLFSCIDFDRFTEHDEALLDSLIEDARKLLAAKESAGEQ